MKPDPPPAESAAPTIRDPRRHKFAMLILEGVPAGRSYERAGYQQRAARADSAGHKLRHHPEVSAFIAHELERQRESAQITRKELIAWLCAIIRTPIGDLDADSPLVQEFFTEEIGDSKMIRKRVKMVQKMDAVKQLCSMMGWTGPEKLELSTSDSLAGLLKRIRGHSVENLGNSRPPAGRQ